MEAPLNGGDLEAVAQNGMMGLSDTEPEVPALRLRLLCPHALVPALIGKKGENVKRIRRESGATLSVADPVLGCDERVVHIMGERQAQPLEPVEAAASSSAADALCGVFASICSLQQARRGEAPPPSPPAASPPPASPRSAAGGEEGPGPGPGGGGSVADGGGGGGGGSSAASTAGDHSAAGSAGHAAAAASLPQRSVEARLLVDSSVVGFLVGRGGATIKDTMARSGAGVRILPKAELPACACLGDEVVRVVGSCEAACAALRLLASQIKAHVLRHGPPPPSPSYPGAPGALPPLMLGQAGHHHPDVAFLHPSLAAAAFYPPPASPAGLPPPPAFSGAAVEVTFRLLAPTNRTGNIIGKGGEHVRRVRTETGARIKVFDPAPGSEERASVGMVLGKRGATVSQLRQETGAAIKVLNADLVPPAYGGGLGSDDSEAELGSISSGGGGSSGGGVASGAGTASSGMSGGGEEVVQVEGSLQQCVAALRGVATLLRGWQVRRLLAHHHHAAFGGGMAAGAAAAALQQQAALAQQPLSPTAGGMLSPSSPGMLGLHLPSSLGSLGSPVQPPFLLMNGHLGGQQQQAGMLPPDALAGPPPGGHLSQQAQRGATYVYHLSNAQVGAVLGKGGAHIAQIRSMSGARVQLQGEGEGGGRVLMVAGQPEQCHAAHTMANAFLSMGRCEPAFPEPILGG
ncbi:hypothetical protein CHLNCDRAFT_57590 [Chlorella variabilis]|uniref:K Homology domain-containing protein n=1 Tax=Chlorella variabilis TaxID=554065 RepID=E1ZCY0_CHLVA|nr:hypothetical protein CHLNCDRAFT_57590 [Chlorella variabilis]EFN56318.1 hypothetical protein CHLNCDRAFT_57590 [Chlorella variabilis]|eukprot:XP_005848420.1 hypothetical protein CHLNCDRAFT_57590 [Chlorella variabilis]